MKTILTFLAVVVVAAVLLYPLQKSATDPYDSFGKRIIQAIGGAPASSTSKAVFGTTGDLVDFSIPRNSTVSGVTDASGILKGGYFFEATARGMLLDATKTEVKSFPITAVGEWMTSEGVAFTMSFDASDMPAGPGYIRIANDNPSGDPANDKFVDVPVKFQ